MQALSNTLGPADQVSANDDTQDLPIVIGLISILTLLLATVAGLGVLNTVVLQARERMHDLGVFKAAGMTPRQVIAVVVCSGGGTGQAAGVIAIPAGVALHKYVAAPHGRCGRHRPAGQLPERLPRSGARHPCPGRGCHRGDRSTAPGGLGRHGQHGVRPPRRVRLKRQNNGEPGAKILASWQAGVDSAGATS